MLRLEVKFSLCAFYAARVDVEANREDLSAVLGSFSELENAILLACKVADEVTVVLRDVLGVVIPIVVRFVDDCLASFDFLLDRRNHIKFDILSTSIILASSNITNI